MIAVIVPITRHDNFSPATLDELKANTDFPDEYIDIICSTPKFKSQA